jgi:hypothetical protein
VESLVEIFADPSTSPELLHPFTFVAEAAAALMSWAGREVELPDFGDQADVRTQYFRTGYELVQAARALRSGSLAEALTHARAGLEAEVQLSGVADDLHVYWPLAMRLALLAGDEDALSELMEIADLIEDELGMDDSLSGHVLVFRAVLDLGHAADTDPAESERDLRQGIEVLEKTGNTVWCAHAREDLGRLLLSQGRVEEGRHELEAARASYVSMGAGAWVARVDETAKVQTR